jgi:pyruvate-formate lyase-activating enzyme
MYCPRERGRHVALDLSLLERGLDELARMPDLALKVLGLHDGGEPLLHPRIDEALRILAVHRPRLSRVGQVVLTTNGTLVRGDLARLLAECRGIDFVSFSIDGGSPEAYERMRRGARWSQVAGNVREFAHLVRRGDHPKKIGIQCLVPGDRPLDQSWMAPEFRRLLDVADGVQLLRLHHFDGTQDLDGIKADPRRKSPAQPCMFLENMLVILASGQATMCCADVNHRGNLGHLGRSTLMRIWSGRRRATARSRWRRGLFDAIEPCRTCEGFVAPDPPPRPARPGSVMARILASSSKP